MRPLRSAAMSNASGSDSPSRLPCHAETITIVPGGNVTSRNSTGSTTSER